MKYSDAVHLKSLVREMQFDLWEKGLADYPVLAQSFTLFLAVLSEFLSTPESYFDDVPESDS